ncbi:MAG: sporulation protein YqfD [Bacillota bacterium]
MRFISYLRGYVSLVVEGRALERFINMAVSRGIKFWDVARLDKERLILRVRLGAVGSLRHIARRTACSFKVTEKMGLPFMIWSMRKRKALYGGALFFFAVLYFLSSFVWSVEVHGAKRTDPAVVRRVAAEAGLKTGTLRYRVRETEVEQLIMEKLPDIAWVGVDVQGSKARVTIAEKKLPVRFPTTPAHVVARKTGLVKELLVLEGQPLVSEGDTVIAGQVLISGVVVPEEVGESGTVPGPPVYVRAKGLVRARVWYQGYGEAALLEKGSRDGKVARTLFIKTGEREIRLVGPRQPPFRSFKVRKTSKRPMQWRNFGVPVELIIKEYVELVPYETRRSRAQARELAEKRARSAVSSSLPGQRLILRQNVEEIRTAQPEGLVRVRLKAEVLEEIGVVKDFNP